MSSTKHFWAVGYDDTERANQVRDEIIGSNILGWSAAGYHLTP